MKFVIVGCGLSGITAARLLKDKGHEVKIFESRNHIGGNCYDVDIGGLYFHKYGPHIFHTDDEEVFEFLSRYTEWIDLEYKPIGRTQIGDIPLPYHDKGCEAAIGRTLSQGEIKKYIFKDYSEKQWGVDFGKIPKTITNRIPKTKNSKSPTWFEGQKYQCVPKEGYTKMFEKMLDGVEVVLNAGQEEWRGEDYNKVIYTGRIDQYFNYCFGQLPYRSLKLKHYTTIDKQDALVYNECNKKNKWTRQYDHSYFSLNHSGETIITREYPKRMEEGDIPFYPIPWGEGQEIYLKYEELAQKEVSTMFLGRLAKYKYLDMWVAVKHVFLKFGRDGGIISYK